MQRKILGLLTMGFVAACAEQPAEQPAADPLSSQQRPVEKVVTSDPIALSGQTDKVSYSIGVNIGKDLKRQGIEINDVALARGLSDAAAGRPTLISEQEAQEAMAALQKEMTAHREEEARVAGEKNKAEGEAFLAQNKTKEGVVTLPSGLQYKVLQEGTGRTPSATDTVETHYRGTLIDGLEFDSSYSRGKTASFPVNRVIKGWTEALQLMKEGAKWQLVIPAELAYGASPPHSSKIGPNAVLLFDIELIKIQ